MKVKSGQSFSTIYRFQLRGEDRFQVRWHESGVIKRETVRTEREAVSIAQRAADRLAAGDSGAISLDGSEAAAYRRALESCGGVPIDAFCAELEYLRKRMEGTPVIRAVDDFITRQRGKNMEVEKGLEKFLAETKAKLARKELSPDYVRNMERRLKKFSLKFKGRNFREVSDIEIRSYVDGLGVGPRTRKNERSAIVTFWLWARENGLLPRDITTEAQRVKAPEIKRTKPVGIFTPAEMEKMLCGASKKILPIMAICAFSGIRSGTNGEISRLVWEDILWDEDLIHVRESKLGPGRHVPFLPNLRAWLEPFRGKTGKLWKGKRIDHAFLYWSNKAGVKWRHNGLRHSYGSHRLRVVKSEPQVAYEMGNSVAVVKRCYVHAVTENQAEKYFALMPPA